MERWKSSAGSERSALEAGDCVSESQGRFDRESGEETIKEAAVESISSAGGVPAINLECRRIDVFVVVVSEDTAIAERCGDQRRPESHMELFER